MTRKFLDSITVANGAVTAVSFDAIAAADLPPGAEVPAYSTTNKDAGSLASGAVVRVHGSGTGVLKADASVAGGDAVGLAQAAALSLAAVSVQTDGPFTLADWTAVTGTVSLAAKATYWLDVTAGKLTTSPPSTAGLLLQIIGEAVAPQTLDLHLGPVILL